MEEEEKHDNRENHLRLPNNLEGSSSTFKSDSKISSMIEEVKI